MADDRNRLTLELTASLHGIPRVRKEDPNTLEVINVSIGDTEAVIRFRVLNATLWPKVLFFLLDHTTGNGFKMAVLQPYFKHRGEIVYCWQINIVSETGITAAVNAFRNTFLLCANSAVGDPETRTSTRTQRPAANPEVAEDLSKMDERAAGMAESAPTTVRALLHGMSPSTAATPKAPPSAQEEAARPRVPAAKRTGDENSQGVVPRGNEIVGASGESDGFRAVPAFPVDMSLFGRRDRVGKAR